MFLPRAFPRQVEICPHCPEIVGVRDVAAAAGLGRAVPSGHVFRAERKRGPVWYAKYRLPDGRQSPAQARSGVV